MEKEMSDQTQNQIQYTVGTFATTNDKIQTADAATMLKLVRDNRVYEVVPDTGYIKPYFDIDYDTRIPVNEYYVSILGTYSANLIISELKKKTGIEPMLAIGESHRTQLKDGEYKYSIRFWIPNIKTTKQECGEFVKYLNSLDHSEINDKFPKFQFDAGIYTKGRKMRCVNSTKPDEPNRPLSLENGSVEDTIISHFYTPPQGTLKMEIKTAAPSVRSITNGITTSFTYTQSDLDNAKLLTSIFPPNLLDTRENWIQYTWAMFNLFGNGGYELWDSVCKRYDKYDEDANLKFWESLSTKPQKSENRVGWKRLHEWASKSQDYKHICSQMKGIPPDYYISIDDITEPFKAAKIISKTIRNYIRICSERWFILNKQNLWNEVRDPTCQILTEINKYIDRQTIKTAKRKEGSHGDERTKLEEALKKWNTMSHLVSKPGYLSTFTRTLRGIDEIVDNTFTKKLDILRGKLAFQNGILDLATLVLEPINCDHYVTQTIPHDWTGMCSFDDVNHFMKQIMNNNDEHLNYLASIIGYSMTGYSDLEKSIYFMIDKTSGGRGDNGKTLVFDMLETILPNYVKKSKSSLIEKGNTKSHKQLSDVQGKRIIYLEELPKNNHIDASLTKELADGKNSENERLFETKMSNIVITGKLFVLSNHLPKIDAEEEAVYNRYKQVSFNSHFDRTGTRTEVNLDKLEFIADTGLADKIKNEYVNQVISFVVHYANKYIANNKKLPSIPLQFKKDTEQTKSDNDTFKTWFYENYEVTESDDDRIPADVLTKNSGNKDKKIVIEAMKRLGFTFDKDLCKIGKDPETGKYYKGGFKGIREKEDDSDFDE